jgi:hypothetical protein
MHPRKALQVHQNQDGDIVVSIVLDGMPIGDIVASDHNAVVEFCNPTGGGGRSLHTRRALLQLLAAMKNDNTERPDADPDQVK